MRLIHTFDNHKQALQFSKFLNDENILNDCEIKTNSDWGSNDYGIMECNIWIIDEDDVKKAEKWLKEYLDNPSASYFSESKSKIPLSQLPKEEIITPESKPKIPNQTIKGLTLFLLISCILIYIYGSFTAPRQQSSSASLPQNVLISPKINKELLYDYPRAYEILDKFISAYGLDKLGDLAELPEKGRLLLEQFLSTPYWTGIYDKILSYFTLPGYVINWNAPMFEKIREGEVWRLFTPCLLHLNAIHLFFNMIWLLVLGRLSEERLVTFRYALLIIICGIVSNTSQYLMSGAGFIGLSGVVCALLGFIWARQQVAAWEGYNLQPGTLAFLLFIILAMAGIQATSFLVQAIWKGKIGIEIANTAHISGLIMGYLMGLLPFFSIKLS